MVSGEVSRLYSAPPTKRSDREENFEILIKKNTKRRMKEKGEHIWGGGVKMHPKG